MNVRIPATITLAALAILNLSACGRGGLAGRLDDANRAARPADRANDGRAAANQASIEPVLDGTVSVLMINGQTITIDDVLDPLRDNLTQRLKSLPPGEYERYLVGIVQEHTRALARDALVYAEASRNLADAENEQIDRFIDQHIRDRVNADFDGRQTRFERSLTDEGTTLAAERERLRREFVIARWVRTTIHPKTADPTRNELYKVFESQREALARPERREMQLIELSIAKQLPVDVTAPSRAQLDAARVATRQKTETLRQRILQGEDFTELAREHSDGVQSGSGGVWGWVAHGSLREKYDPAVDALFALPSTSETSPVVETREAFFLVRATNIEPASAPDFESLQPELIAHFRNTRFNELIEEEIGRLQASADIRPPDIGRFIARVLQDAPRPDSNR